MVERMVCESPALRQADQSLTTAYLSALGKSKDRVKLTDDQRKWINDVRNACETESCLNDAYIKRISELNGSFAGTRTAPRNNEFFCWGTTTTDIAPRVLEIAFQKKPDGSYDKTAHAKKFDNVPAVKLAYKGTISTQETSPGRPLEFTQLWQEPSSRRTPIYEIVSQGFPRHLRYYPSGLNGKYAEYDPIGTPADSSCFAEALATIRK